MRLLFASLFLLSPAAAATTAAAGPLLGASISPNGQSVSAPMQIVILMTLLTLLPAAVMSVTPFLRISVVLHFLRQALGTQTVPSNQVLVGLSLFLTILVMQPVAADMYHQGWEPMEQGKMNATQAIDAGSQPLRVFLSKFAREKDISLFVDMTHSTPPRTPADLEMKVLIPAYILSELKAGFQIGAVLYLPFLVIDLTIASVTVSVGMMQLPPVMLSAPFKILLFVLVDGWNLVIGSLMKGLIR
ncbi:MAG: flagellar type III secretion system pore protein FliP [Ignavibacteriota bacterium]